MKTATLAGFIFGFAVASASAAPADLEAVKSGRSVVAEMQLLQRTCAAGRAPAVYCNNLFAQGTDELSDTARGATRAEARRALQVGAKAAAAHDAHGLQAAFDKLRALETAYEQGP